MKYIKKEISKSAMVILEMQAICVLCTGKGLEKDLIKCMQKAPFILNLIALTEIERGNRDYIGGKYLLN